MGGKISDLHLESRRQDPVVNLQETKILQKRNESRTEQDGVAQILIVSFRESCCQMKFGETHPLATLLTSGHPLTLYLLKGEAFSRCEILRRTLSSTRGTGQRQISVKLKRPNRAVPYAKRILTQREAASLIIK
jgi:hypothetical protein